MKNSFKIFIISAMVLVAVSCETSPSTLNYVLDGNLDYAASGSNITAFTDSTYNSAYIGMDSYSYLVSDYEVGVLSRGWTLSLKYGQTLSTGEFTPFSSAGNKAGAFKSAVYAVFYDNPSSKSYYDLVFTFSNVTSYVCTLNGFMINNSGIVRKFIDGGSLAQGDYMKVVVTAYRKDAVVGTAEKYLIDYTGAELKSISDWEEFKFVDLTESVDAVKFAIDTNRPDIPPYFCMDDFTATINLTY